MCGAEFFRQRQNFFIDRAGVGNTGYGSHQKTGSNLEDTNTGTAQSKCSKR
jgi:hypothetical protein